MLFYTFKTLNINLISLLKQVILNINFCLEPHQFQLLQLNQLLIPMRSLIPCDFLKRVLNRLHSFGMIFFQFKCIVELFLFFQEYLIKVQLVWGLGQSLWLVNVESSLLFAQFEFVPLNVCVWDEQLLCCCLHIGVSVVGGFKHWVK